MPPREPIPPPIRCGARSKQSGQTCRAWAKPGLFPPRCHTHGGAPGSGPPPPNDAAGKAEAGRWIATLTQRLSGDRRPVWEVIADAVHTADALMAEARAVITQGGQVTPDALERLADATRLAHGLAAAAVTARAAELQGLAAAAWSDRIAATIHALIHQWLGLPAGSVTVQDALRGALSEVDPEKGDAPAPPPGWQTWTDQAAEALAVVLAPRLGLAPEAVRAWLAAALAAVGTRAVPELPGSAVAAIEAAVSGSERDPLDQLDRPEPVPEDAASGASRTHYVGDGCRPPHPEPEPATEPVPAPEVLTGELLDPDDDDDDDELSEELAGLLAELGAMGGSR